MILQVYPITKRVSRSCGLHRMLDLFLGMVGNFFFILSIREKINIGWSIQTNMFFLLHFSRRCFRVLPMGVLVGKLHISMSASSSSLPPWGCTLAKAVRVFSEIFRTGMHMKPVAWQDSLSRQVTQVVSEHLVDASGLPWRWWQRSYRCQVYVIICFYHVVADQICTSLHLPVAKASAHSAANRKHTMYFDAFQSKRGQSNY